MPKQIPPQSGDVMMDTLLITDDMNESNEICRQLITECIDLSIKRIHQKQMGFFGQSMELWHFFPCIFYIDHL